VALAGWGAGRRDGLLDGLGTLLRLVLAGVFAVAGAQKLPDPAESVRAVRAYRLLPESAVHAVAYGLPVLEIGLAVLLLAGLATRVSAALTAALLVVFLIGVGSAAARGLTIDCGCFGGGGVVAKADTHYTAELVRDALLLLAAVLLVARPRTALSLDRYLAGPTGAPATPTEEYP
jgi:uncharacterized membrane protein YphA (DoxX/SURF4 family)